MAVLLMLKGLPASGKSTTAKKLRREEGYVIVNKDDIRRDLVKESNGAWQWSPEAEGEVLEIRDRLIMKGLRSGHDVVSSDTNLAPKHERRLQDLARQCRAEFVTQSLLDVTVEECIQRDAKRHMGVGERVIRDMYNRYVAPPVVTSTELEIEPYQPKPTLPPAIICDLDGTLASFDGLRGPFEYGKCADDWLNGTVKDVIEACVTHHEWAVIYMSGREDWARGHTLTFLEKHRCPVGDLHMRASEDHRPDTVVKYELFNAHVRDRYDVKLVLDDRPKVLRMWKELGLFTLAVGDLKEF
jgi:predicted kinase